jgi:hypothetical protein
VGGAFLPRQLRFKLPDGRTSIERTMISACSGDTVPAAIASRVETRSAVRPARGGRPGARRPCRGPLAAHQAVRGEWDTFESGCAAGFERWLAEHPDDPEAPETRDPAALPRPTTASPTIAEAGRLAPWTTVDEP